MLLVSIIIIEETDGFPHPARLRRATFSRELEKGALT
jgi:hypothetical protein